MFHINSIQVPPGYSSMMFGGINTDVGPRSPGDRFGPEGSAYVICVHGLGSFFIEDVGQTARGWGVKVNGQSNLIWAYPGEGQASVSVDIGGKVTISGGVGPVTTTLITNMADTGPLLQRIIKSVQGSPRLMSAWNQDAMNVLHMFGFPRTCMYNVDPRCCAQYIAVVQSLQLQPSVQSLAVAEFGDAARLGSWWSCALCKAGEVGIIAANVALIGAIIVATSGAGAPVVAALEESASVVAIAAATGVSVARVAQLAAAVFATSGFSSFVGDFAEALCREGGFCS